MAEAMQRALGAADIRRRNRDPRRNGAGEGKAYALAVTQPAPAR